MIQEVVHHGEHAGIVARSSHNNRRITEGILNDLGHILAAQVSHNDLLRALGPQDFAQLFGRFRRVSVELYPKTVTTYPHAKETLISLKNKGYKLGIVTNKINSSTVLCLKLIGLEGIFDSLVCYDDVKNPKPHGEPILKGANELGASDLSKVLYIGDNKIDLDTANNADVDCALVSWGPRVLDKNLKPTFTISSFEDLERKLN